MGELRTVPDAGSGFGAVLKHFRLAAGLSQEALAERAHISADAVSALERGVRRVPYRDTVALLAEALQLSPADRQRMEEAADRRRGPRDRPTAAESSDFDDLQAPLTPLIGRERDLTHIATLFARSDVRLLTLTGPGGSGKTRLAIQAAQNFGTASGVHVTLVSLAAVREAQLIGGAIAAAAGVRPGPGQTVLDALRLQLQDGPRLLVLDNFEHLVSAAPLVLDLIRACPELCVLVTSREPLRVRGEVEYPVAPLDSLDATELFVGRARAADPHFVPAGDDGVAIAEIVRRLDRLPLALELAAPFVRTWSPTALLARLERPLELLVGGPRDAPERQRTMRRTIEWSYNLLDSEEQRLLRLLSVFVESFPVEAVEAVYGGAWFDPFTSLAAKSLLHQTRTGEGDALVGMLETVREFALERLRESGEFDDASRKQARYVAAFANDVRLGLRGESSAAWLRRCDRQLGNVRAVLGWARSAGEYEQGLHVAADLFVYWGRRGLIAEGREWVDAFLNACDNAAGNPSALVRGLLVGGNLAMRQGERRLAEQRFERALYTASQIGDSANVARAEMALGIAAYEERDLLRARMHFERAVPLWRAVGDPYDLVIVRNNYAATLWALGELDNAAAMFQENIAVARASSYSQLLPEILGNLGYLEQQRKNLDASDALLLESLELFRRSGDRFGSVFALTHLGETAALSDDPHRAQEFYREGLRLNATVENREANVLCLEGLARLAEAAGETNRAIRLCTVAARERDHVAAAAESAVHDDARDLLARLRAGVDAEVFARASADAAARSIEQIIAQEFAESPATADK